MPGSKRRRDESQDSPQSIPRFLKCPPQLLGSDVSPHNTNLAVLAGVGARFDEPPNGPRRSGHSSTATHQSSEPGTSTLSLQPACNSFQCPRCPDVRLSSKAAHTRHMNNHNPNPVQYYCSVPGCKRDGKHDGKGFGRNSDLQRHFLSCLKKYQQRQGESVGPFAQTVRKNAHPPIEHSAAGESVRDLEQTMMRTPLSSNVQAHARVLENLEECRQLQLAAKVARQRAWEEYQQKLGELERLRWEYEKWDPIIIGCVPNIAYWRSLADGSLLNQRRD